MEGIKIVSPMGFCLCGNPAVMQTPYGKTMCAECYTKTWRCFSCGAVINQGEPCWNCTNSTPLMPEQEHIRKIRRRIEDFLRKADEDTILRIAKENNIRID